MEFEKKYWIRSKVPTGYTYNKPKITKRKAIHESELGRLKEMRDQGKSVKELSILCGCSTFSVIKTLKEIESQP